MLCVFIVAYMRTHNSLVSLCVA